MRKKIMAAITEHVAAEYPKEACGLVVQVGRAQEYIPCTNVSDNPTEDFLMTNHAAIYLGGNLMLHHNSGNLSTRVPYGDYWRNRTVRVVRRKEFIDA